MPAPADPQTGSPARQAARNRPGCQDRGATHTVRSPQMQMAPFWQPPAAQHGIISHRAVTPEGNPPRHPTPGRQAGSPRPSPTPPGQPAAGPAPHYGRASHIPATGRATFTQSDFRHGVTQTDRRLGASREVPLHAVQPARNRQLWALVFCWYRSAVGPVRLRVRGGWLRRVRAGRWVSAAVPALLPESDLIYLHNDPRDLRLRRAAARLLRKVRVSGWSMSKTHCLSLARRRWHYYWSPARLRDFLRLRRSCIT